MEGLCLEEDISSKLPGSRPRKDPLQGPKLVDGNHEINAHIHGKVCI